VRSWSAKTFEDKGAHLFDKDVIVGAGLALQRLRLSLLNDGEEPITHTTTLNCIKIDR